jgi:hypothetical protein
MSEEQLRILKMIEEKKITAEEGAKLLNALSSAQAARDQATHATERARAEARGWGWAGPPPPVPPTPPVPPVPPVPPMPPFDPFEAAFNRGWGRSERERERDRDRDRDRDRRRGRRDTEPLDSETRRGGGGQTARFFRIRVSDPASGGTLVNVNLPVGLINFGLKVASRYIPEDADIDVEAIQQAIQQGAIGKIIDIQEGTGSHVEISVE